MGEKNQRVVSTAQCPQINSLLRISSYKLNSLKTSKSNISTFSLNLHIPFCFTYLLWVFSVQYSGSRRILSLILNHSHHSFFHFRQLMIFQRQKIDYGLFGPECNPQLGDMTILQNCSLITLSLTSHI